jgi:hypothetical protein
MNSETSKDIDQRNEEYNKGRNAAMGFAMFVYGGVVIAATVVFISFVLSAFPPKAYLSRVIMTLAGLLVGGSMIAFPVALHFWVVDKHHRWVTTVLYYLEMVVIAINTVVGFAHLLAKYAGNAAPEWAVLYEPFSIGAIIYTLAAWGTVFLLDPSHKRKARDLQNQQKFHDKISQRMEEFLESRQGEDMIMDIATKRAEEEYSADRFQTGRKDWGSAPKRLPEPGSSIPPEVLAEIVRQLAEKNSLYPVEHGSNGTGSKDFTNRQR